ncbi:HU family DNA-binding protein [Schlegelella sp. ID0723]|uniref:HU family DNA-binding protein n=2 Tax=Piscinibacter koreensis TaxID=2742824 RepID=A0A7Y6TYN5_9BURK|nr:HU family DNA-binding protein [Schlegelella koreensis]NUZ08271.1 HU family DNA-binding protein [Schlegelella koreensis]
MATAKKAPIKTASKTASRKQATATKVATKAAGPRATAKKASAPVASKTAAPKAASGAMKPIKAAFNKTGLTNHLAETTGVEPRAVKAVMAALENAMIASIGKKGARSFVLPGLLKVTAVATPAQKARRGINPFTKEETTFKAKPASVKLKVRAMKKLKDAAL